MRNFRAHAARSTLFPLTLLGLLSCAQIGLLGPHTPALEGYRYFETPDPYDIWSLKIGEWQASQQSEGAPRSPQEAEGDLRSSYFAFRNELRISQARSLASWIQEEAQDFYTEDRAADHWPTLDQVLSSEGDDCDGLELVVHQLLLDLGFPREEVYRAVVHRPVDGQYHMVTLWFQDPEDPWVIDPTGAMTVGMPRMSEMPSWIPLKIFSASEEFTVRHLSSAR